MPINFVETPVTPAVDLDSDVVVYVPGYAVKGPGDPTLVNSGNFTQLFGEGPYIFKTSQTSAKTKKNNVIKGKGDRSWYFAKGLMDAGLTVLFHRMGEGTVPVPKTAPNVFTINDMAQAKAKQAISGFTFMAKSKYFGCYYAGMNVTLTQLTNGVTSVTVSQGSKVLETANVSFDPSATNFIGSYDFANIIFCTSEGDFSDLDISGYLSENPNAELYGSGTGTLQVYDDNGGIVEDTSTIEEFKIADFENSLANATGAQSAFDDILDTDRYPTVTYITAGGYFIDSTIAGNMMDHAFTVKAMALIDFPDDVTLETFSALQAKFALIPTKQSLARSRGHQVLGCDTFVVNGTRLVMGDSFGYLARIGSNIASGLPAWIPAANNSAGLITSGVATTRPVNKALADEMAFGTVGCSVNPVVYKQNVGYVIMGNRTLYPNSGVLGPQSFLNCMLVVNSTERAARNVANQLLIVSTNANDTFNTFKTGVSKTLDKMLTNGDGLREYNIRHLPKTKPATIDILIELTVVEGIETFNIKVPYSISLD